MAGIILGPMDTGTLIAVFTLVGTIITSTVALLIVGVKTLRHAKDANDAINHRHSGDHPRAFDMIAHLWGSQQEATDKLDEILSWKRSYKDSPWQNGDGVQAWLSDLERANDEHREVHSRIEARLEKCLPKDCT